MIDTTSTGANGNPMQIAVIVADATHAVHVGGEVVRTVRMFELPEEISSYIRSQEGGYVTVSLALDKTP